LTQLINEAADDREFINANDRTILIVENDRGFASFMLDTVREKGFKGLVTPSGAAALALIQDHKPDAILLDIYLADMEGWRVLERLKQNVMTRHIPVCIISTDESRRRAFDSGALAFVSKPLQSRDMLDKLLQMLDVYLEKKKKTVLVIDPDGKRGRQTVADISLDTLSVVRAKDLRSAQSALRKKVDGIILHAEAVEIAEKLAGTIANDERALQQMPVIIHSEEEPDETRWNFLREACSLYRAAASDAVVDPLTAALHYEVSTLPLPQKKKIIDLHQTADTLPDKKVLVVDDDARNIFALTSVLEEHNMKVMSADSGREAIELLKEHPDVDIVLMDIMMPEMDGMETIRQIRQIPQMKNLPIVAVTAKAMKGDREKCIEAGAWDYLSKPVDTEQLVAVLRAWLHHQNQG
jgi:CheY-like chemotaxis protein